MREPLYLIAGSFSNFFLLSAARRCSRSAPVLRLPMLGCDRVWDVFRFWLPCSDNVFNVINPRFPTGGDASRNSLDNPAIRLVGKPRPTPLIRGKTGAAVELSVSFLTRWREAQGLDLVLRRFC